MSINGDDRFWEMILQKIDEQKCILVIGPDIATADASKTINEALKEKVFSNADGEIGYYPDDEFFSFTDDDEKGYAIGNIQKFYKALQPNELHHKITEIPFHLIFSVSPDRLLEKVFNEKNLSYTFAFYNKEQNPEQIDKPTKENPLIYNLFGDIETDGSLVFTYDDLFDYLIKIFGDFKLPQSLQNELKRSSVVLFLGFKFDKWYFKLLLRLLKLNEVKIKGAPNHEKNLMPAVKNFYSDEFKLKFLDCNETEIINFIYEKCKESNTLRIKRSLAASTGSQVFISYAWGGESEMVVDKIYTSLTAKGVNIIRDKINLGYKGNIKSFMENIGKGQYVIIVISDKYLKSENCMFEMLEIRNNGDLYDRIFPVVLSDAGIYKETDRMNYLKFWEDQLVILKEKFRETDPENNLQAHIKITQYGQIKNIVDEITDMIRNMNTLTTQMHESSDFSELLQALEYKISEDQLKPVANGK